MYKVHIVKIVYYIISYFNATIKIPTIQYCKYVLYHTYCTWKI